MNVAQKLSLVLKLCFYEFKENPNRPPTALSFPCSLAPPLFPQALRPHHPLRLLPFLSTLHKFSHSAHTPCPSLHHLCHGTTIPHHPNSKPIHALFDLLIAFS